VKSLDALVVAVRMASEIARQGVDAILEPVGGALPLRPEQASSLASLDRLLAAHSLDPSVGAGRLRAVRRLEIESVSSNCNNSVLALDWQDDDNDDLPGTAFLKLPSASLLTRAFCNLIRIWRLECRFYQKLAPKVPIRVPRAYAAGDQGSRFFLLLEDLHADPDVSLHTNPDLMKGASLGLARRCLSTLANLHAAFWGLSESERDALLESSLHPMASPHARPVNLVINHLALAPCRRRAPDIMTEDMSALFRRGMSRWDDLCGFWYSKPLTLIHGDSHLGNFFVSGETTGMLDWQAAMWAKGVRDVQYFLINSLPAEVLAVHELDLLDHYLAELGRHGVALARDEAWSQYRAYSFQTLMTHVVSLGLGTLTEQEHVMRTLLARAVTAVRRVRFADWLDELELDARGAGGNAG
jgi:hypothetical protein